MQARSCLFGCKQLTLKLNCVFASNHRTQTAIHSTRSTFLPKKVWNSDSAYCLTQLFIGRFNSIPQALKDSSPCIDPDSQFFHQPDSFRSSITVSATYFRPHNLQQSTMDDWHLATPPSSPFHSQQPTTPEHHDLHGDKAPQCPCHAPRSASNLVLSGHGYHHYRHDGPSREACLDSSLGLQLTFQGSQAARPNTRRPPSPSFRRQVLDKDSEATLHEVLNRADVVAGKRRGMQSGWPFCSSYTDMK